MIKKAVITAAGSGTRLLPATKEMAKELLPFYSKTREGFPILKPMLQSIYQSLFGFGIRNYCIVVGRNRRSIEDHFSINHELMKKSIFKKEKILKKEIRCYFDQLNRSKIIYQQQMLPKGFGDAVLHSKNFVGDDNFILHTGDDYIISKQEEHFSRLDRCITNFNADIGLLIQKVKNPENYGVVEIKSLKNNYYKIISIEEKPKKPKSNFAIVGIYSFTPLIMDYLKLQKPDKNNEIQLTSAIQEILSDNYKIIGTKVLKNEKRLDIGTPENYAKSIISSYRAVKNK